MMLYQFFLHSCIYYFYITILFCFSCRIREFRANRSWFLGILCFYGQEWALVMSMVGVLLHYPSVFLSFL